MVRDGFLIPQRAVGQNALALVRAREAPHSCGAGECEEIEKGENLVQ